jgi:hypothetical protein
MRPRGPRLRRKIVPWCSQHLDESWKQRSTREGKLDADSQGTFWVNYPATSLKRQFEHDSGYGLLSLVMRQLSRREAAASKTGATTTDIRWLRCIMT